MLLSEELRFENKEFFFYCNSVLKHTIMFADRRFCNIIINRPYFGNGSRTGGLAREELNLLPRIYRNAELRTHLKTVIMRC